MIESRLKRVYMMKIMLNYEILENLDFDEKKPKTSEFIDFSISNIQISYATPRDSRTHASAWKI